MKEVPDLGRANESSLCGPSNETNREGIGDGTKAGSQLADLARQKFSFFYYFFIDLAQESGRLGSARRSWTVESIRRGRNGLSVLRLGDPSPESHERLVSRK